MNNTEYISVYTRQQAIEDGIFIDVSQVAKEWGFKIPVALTTNLYCSHIKKADESETNKRLSTFLGILRKKINESKEEGSMLCTKIAFSESKEPTDVWAVIEGQSPAMNVMLPEDY